MTDNGYRVFTKGELRDFDDRAKEIILSAQALGAVCRLSNRGHMIVRAKNGMTISVSRNLSLANRSSQNARAQFKRAFGKEVGDVPDKEKEKPVVVTPESPGVVLACPAKGCHHTFSGPHAVEARDLHIDREHYRCTEPGCTEVLAKRQGVGGHVATAHRGNKPWVKAQEMMRGKPRPPRKPKPVDEPVEPRATRGGVHPEDAPVIQQIRALLGEDPRLAELEKENAELRAKVGELEARLSLVKEAFGA